MTGDTNPPPVTVEAITHSQRFRRVSNKYPHRVAEAYGGNLAQALADSDEQVAATVAEWERKTGTTVRDWKAQGESERGER